MLKRTAFVEARKPGSYFSKQEIHEQAPKNVEGFEVVSASDRKQTALFVKID